MSKGAIIGIVLVLLVVVGAVVAYFLMSGEDGTVGPGQAAIDYVEGDIIRIERTTGPIMLMEVLVYDKDDKLISHDNSATLTSSPTHPGWGDTTRLNDWDIHSAFHSKNDDLTTYVQIKFSSVKKIKRIQVINRADDRSAEIDQLKIKVLNGTTTVVTSPSTPTWTQGKSYLVEYDPKKNVFVTEDTVGTPLKVTDVVIVNPHNDNLIISEIQIIDKNDVNVALTGTATLSSTHHPDWAAANAIDGNLTNTAHSADQRDAIDTLTINLGGEKEIKSIKIYNRVDDMPTRVQIAKSYVQFKKSGTTIFTTPPIPDGDRATYEYKVGKYMNRWKLT